MVLLAFSLLFATGDWPLPVEREPCRQTPAPGLPGGDDLVFLPTDSSLVPAIFPAGALERFTCMWFSHELHTLGDGPLEPETGASLYRFTWLRSFQSPVRYRLGLPDDGTAGWVDWAVVTTRDGLRSAPTTGHRDLTETETADLRAAATRADLCAISVELDTYGLDGEEWLYESVSEANYCFAHRWSPPEGEFRSFGAGLIEITELAP
tara:strand:+ start:941 stop:1564 length:624 start_codon:yes stop_codon:yes gene_type:complete